MYGRISENWRFCQGAASLTDVSPGVKISKVEKKEAPAEKSLSEVLSVTQIKLKRGKGREACTDTSSSGSEDGCGQNGDEEKTTCPGSGPPYKKVRDIIMKKACMPASL